METLTMTHFISIFSLLDIMRRNQHSGIFLLRDLDQIIPNTVKKKIRQNIYILKNIYFFFYYSLRIASRKKAKSTCFSLKTGSKPTVGSSKIKSSGLWINEAAKESLLC